MKEEEKKSRRRGGIELQQRDSMSFDEFPRLTKFTIATPPISSTTEKKTETYRVLESPLSALLKAPVIDDYYRVRFRRE